MKSLYTLLLACFSLVCTEASAANCIYAGTYTGYLSGQPQHVNSLPEVFNSFVTLTVDTSGNAQLTTYNTTRALLATGQVGAGGVVAVSGTGLNATLKISRIGKVNTGAAGTGAIDFCNATISLQNIKAVGQLTVAPKLAAGTYFFLAKGDVDFGFAGRVGSGTLTVSKTTWTGSIKIAHMTVSLKGSVAKDGSLKVVSPSRYASGKLTVAPFTVGANYVGFRGRYKSPINGIQIDMYGVKTS